MESATYLIEKFLKWKQRFGEQAFLKVNDFFQKERELFYEKKKKSHPPISDVSVRQSWVSTLGCVLEKIVEMFIEDFCKKHHLRFTRDKDLIKKNLPQELDLVRRAITIYFGKYAYLPDADLIIYKIENHFPKVLAILSIKNSFRERYTQTPFWKQKLNQSSVTKHIKVFMITPDKDQELSSLPIKKACAILQWELDGIYLATENPFEKNNKIKPIEYLKKDLETIL